MQFACAHMLRRCRHIDHQLAGLALTTSEGVSLSEACNEALNNDSAAERIAGGAYCSSSARCFGLPQPRRLSAQPSNVWPWHLAVSVRFASSESATDHQVRRREVLREAAKKVSPDSTWLLAFSNNISPRQLTFRLGKRDSLPSLREGWKLYEHKFDTIAMAALLRRVRVAQLQGPRADYDPASAQGLLDELVPRLRAIALRFGNLRSIAAYLHALAKLRSPLPGDQASDVDGEGAPASPASAASAAAAESESSAAAAESSHAAPLSQPTDLLLDLAAFATRDRTAMLHARPRDLATLLWALRVLLPEQAYGDAKLQVVLDRVALASLRRLQNFDPLDMRWMALGFATFGPRGLPPAASSAPAASAAAAAAGGGGSSAAAAAEDLVPSGTSSTAWPATPGKRPRSATAVAAGGAASAGQGAADVTPPEQRRLSRNARVLEAIAAEMSARASNPGARQPHPRDMVLTAHALATQAAAAAPSGAAAAPPTSFVPFLAQAAASAAEGGLSQLSPEEGVVLVEALAAAGVRQGALMEAVRGQVAAEGGWGRGLRAAEAEALRGRLAAAFERLGAKL